MTDRELMKWALYALEGSNAYDWPVVEELKERLEQPEQEPVAWMCKRDDGHFDVLTDQTCKKCFPVYTAPQKKEWQVLTDEEIDILSCEMVKGDKSVNWLCKVLEAKLKEKNS